MSRIAGARFDFGDNWTRFLAEIDEGRVAAAERSLQELLGVEGLEGRTLLDAGCGSGLFSLAARRLGARVRSFDADRGCVACAQTLRDRFLPGDPLWSVDEGSVLDEAFLAGLGSFDVVYSWGVLHHTGAMWPALALAAGRVAEGGLLCVALYNDQGWRSRAWRLVKRAYVGLPGPLRPLVLYPAFLRLWGPRTVFDLLRGRPFETWRRYGRDGKGRGMSPWRDVVDWVGGHPFEVARPEEVRAFLAARGFALVRERTVGRRLGNNEFVFRRM